MSLFVRAMGIASPVGLNWRAACAAMRGGIDRKRELPTLVDNHRQPIVASHLAQLDASWTPRRRWMHLLSLALEDALGGTDDLRLEITPIIVALPTVIDSSQLAEFLSTRLSRRIDGAWIRVIADGSPAGYQALFAARDLLSDGRYPGCIVAAADSWIGAVPLAGLGAAGRLCTPTNSDGIIPGEAATCLVVTKHRSKAMAAIRGFGFAVEESRLDNDVPLRASGIVAATRMALSEAGLQMHELDFRVSDAAGESFYFKEQSLLVSRLLRQRKEDFPLWLAAGALGDTGASAGLCGLIAAVAGMAKSYAPGTRAICCAGNPEGRRATLILEAIREELHG